MVYNNLFQRIFISFFLLTVYLIITINFINYLIILILIIYVIIMTEVFLNFKKFKYFILIYLFISFLFFYNVNLDNKNIIKFHIMIIIISSFDIFSYFIGYNFGKIKILKNLSPNKTLEGFIGGLICTIIIVMSCFYFLFLNLNFNFFIFTLIIIFSSFLGDIIESYFKRKNNLKNSSKFLPGHGGFFDRFDSFIFSSIPFYFLSNIL